VLCFRASNCHSLALGGAKSAFLNSLDKTDNFNTASKTRTEILNDLVAANPTKRPGAGDVFSPIACGTWKIIYAPHISTLSGLVGGSFNPVVYDMKSDGTITSHARYEFPLLGHGWLSVSGTYGSEDENRMCRVDFDKGWLVPEKESSQIPGPPAASLEVAPDTFYKDAVNKLAKLGFRREFSVFPVSYLDHDLIVFDFELFGTRICARKVSPRPFL
jgi:hypothetical protein